MTDLSRTIAPKSDQLNSDDLIAGPRTITIRGVKADPGTPEQPILMFFDGDEGKPYKPCKSMRRVLVTAWGPNGEAYVGRSLTLYRDPEVMFGGIKVGGARISHMTHIDDDLTLALTASKAQRKPYRVRKMAEPKPPQSSAGNVSTDLEALKDEARLAAEQGKTTFLGFWNRADVKGCWPELKPFLPEYQRLCAEADRRGAPTEPDPFTVSDEPLPTDEDRVRALAEAEEQARADAGAQ